MISDNQQVITSQLHRIDYDEAEECHLFHRTINLHREPSDPVVRIVEDGIVACLKMEPFRLTEGTAFASILDNQHGRFACRMIKVSPMTYLVSVRISDSPELESEHDAFRRMGIRYAAV